MKHSRSVGEESRGCSPGQTRERGNVAQLPQRHAISHGVHTADRDWQSSMLAALKSNAYNSIDCQCVELHDGKKGGCTAMLSRAVSCHKIICGSCWSAASYAPSLSHLGLRHTQDDKDCHDHNPASKEQEGTPLHGTQDGQEGLG